MTAQKLDLSNIGGGELMAMTDREIVKLCENIADPNVSTGAVRKISINIEVHPDPKGVMATIKYSVKSTLAGPDASVTSAYIAMAPGTTDIRLFGADVRQADLFAEPLVSEIKPTAVTGVAAPMPTGSFAPSSTQN